MTVARRPALRNSEFAWGATISAEWAHFVGLGVFAYTFGGTTAVGIAGLVRLLPAAVLAPFAAPLADRYRREQFLVCVSVVGATGLFGSAVAASVGASYVVFVGAAVVGISSTLFRPALQALLPSLAQTPEELIAANGTTSTLEGVGTLVGPMAAAVLMSVFSIATLFAAAGFVLVAAALLLTRVSAEGQQRFSDGPSASLRERLRILHNLPAAQTIIGLMAVQTFVRGCLNVLLVVASFEVLHRGSIAVGFLTGAIGVGALVGAVAASMLNARRLVPIFAVSLAFWSLPIAPLGFMTRLLLAALVVAVIGAANSVEDVAGFTLLQRIVPNDVLTGLLGIFWESRWRAPRLAPPSPRPLSEPLAPARPSFWSRHSFLRS